MTQTAKEMALKTASREKLIERLRQAWYIAGALSNDSQTQDQDKYLAVKDQLAVLGLIVAEKKSPTVALVEELTVDPLTDDELDKVLPLATSAQQYPCQQ